MKIAISKSYGGFHLTQEQREALIKLHPGLPDIDTFVGRDDPSLILAIEQCPGGAVTVVEIPDDVKWQIDDYDGYEWVAEQHRTWS